MGIFTDWATCPLFGIMQVGWPVLAPVLDVYSFPWLAPLATLLVQALPAIYALIALPILDMCLGEEEDEGAPIPQDAWYKPVYRLVCHGFIVLHIAALIFGAHAATSASLPLFMLLCFDYSLLGGFAFVIAHELVHSSHKVDRWCAELLLTTVCYKQWGLSHMQHHAHVATFDDPASARYRESVRHCFPDSTIMQLQPQAHHSIAWQRSGTCNRKVHCSGHVAFTAFASQRFGSAGVSLRGTQLQGRNR
jgi:Fatty acid desaturase